MAHSNRHDDLLLGIEGSLGFVALEAAIRAFHAGAVGFREIPLGLLLRRSLRLGLSDCRRRRAVGKPRDGRSIGLLGPSYGSLRPAASALPVG